ncbi:MAG: taurine---2-oxoglutarate transaminase, partial [Pseudonocardiales bacterium]|nr:taurine---2-oxoglutarate transaminase [Pseudonocardiales bacterium]
GTNTAVNLTGDPRRWANDLGTTGSVHFFGPFLYRSVFHSSTEEEECQRALEHLEQVIDFEGPQTIAAIILETIPGTAGIMPPPPGYLAGVRALCDKYGIIYIADEVMCGFGRTGAWFALDHYDVQPDLIAFAKGVNSGYVPLGGVIISQQIVDTFADRVFPGGLTYSGHPLACAAAVATLTAMAEEGIVDNAAQIGETVIGPGLRELAERHPIIGEVRGLGVFWALDLVTDRATKEPLAPYGGTSPAMGELVGALKANGVLPFTNYHRLHIVPPCIITADEAREGLAAVDKALASIGHHYIGS